MRQRRVTRVEDAARLVSITSLNCSGVIEATCVKMPTPALLTRMSSPPNRATVASIRPLHIFVAANIRLQRFHRPRTGTLRSSGGPTRDARRCAL